MLKQCSICGETKSVDEFYRTHRDKDTRHSRCIACSKVYQKQRKYRYPENDRKYQLKNLYGLSSEEYEELLEKSDHRCQVCGTQERRLCVDHDHVTGEVRGILCHRCNSALGFLNDDPTLVEALGRYLSC